MLLTLAVLSNGMPWQEIEASLARQVRPGKKIENSDLFGVTEVIAGAGISKAGRPLFPRPQHSDCSIDTEHNVSALLTICHILAAHQFESKWAG